MDVKRIEHKTEKQINYETKKRGNREPERKKNIDSTAVLYSVDVERSIEPQNPVTAEMNRRRKFSSFVSEQYCLLMYYVYLGF